jgi:hypothetical protein
MCQRQKMMSHRKIQHHPNMHGCFQYQLPVTHKQMAPLAMLERHQPSVVGLLQEE